MNDVATTLKRLLSELPGLQLAFLFGSHASGTARPDGDIDLAILLDTPPSPELEQSLMKSVAAKLGCPVDIVDLLEAPEPITGEALKGQRLTGDDVAYAKLLTRHVINVADFLPLRQRILDERRRAWLKQ